MTISKFFGVEINDSYPRAVLEFNFTEVMQVRLPVSIFRQIRGDTLTHQYVPGIAQSHYALSNVNPNTGNVRLVVHVPNLIHRTAVDSHPQSNLRMVLQGRGNFHGAMHRFFWTLKEDKSHPVAYRNPDELTSRLTLAKLRCLPYDLIKVLDNFTLIVDEQL